MECVRCSNSSQQGQQERLLPQDLLLHSTECKLSLYKLMGAWAKSGHILHIQVQLCLCPCQVEVLLLCPWS